MCLPGILVFYCFPRLGHLAGRPGRAPLACPDPASRGPVVPDCLGGCPSDATFPVLFGIGIAAALAEIVQRRRYRRRVAGLLVLLSAMMLTSAFTVTVFNALQLGIILPFVLLLGGAGVDSALQRISGLRSGLSKVPQRHCSWPSWWQSPYYRPRTSTPAWPW